MICYVNQLICIKCGLCESLNCNIFKKDNSGDYRFILPLIDDKTINIIKTIADKCPVDAVVLE